MTPVEEIELPSRAQFEAELRPLYRPLVIRGAALHWPIVDPPSDREGRQERLLAAIERFDSGAQTDIMVAPPEAKGRFFYTPDVRGFNFRRERASLSQLAQLLGKLIDDPNPPAVYAGAAAAGQHLPGFEANNPFELVEPGQSAARIWLGNATQVATHFDLSDNFAVVVEGKRRFTLFPPDTIDDLYVGPLDVTLAGQPVSMVDPLAPDLERYPRFTRAQDRALVTELEPGDAIYIPTLWWHHVTASAQVNMLVNYWHNDAQHGGGFVAMVHAVMSIRDLPQPQREAWKSWFDHMVFAPEAPRSADHIPDPARGVTGPPSPERDARIRQFIARVLTRA